MSVIFSGRVSQTTVNSPKIRVNSAAIRELECLPWAPATLAVSRLLRFQFPITGSVASGRISIPIAPAFDIGHTFLTNSVVLNMDTKI